MCVLGKFDVPGAGRPKILVVEDEFLIALTLQSVLEDAGFEVLGPVLSVNAALDLLENHRPDAAVLDINLRGEFVTPVAHKLKALGVPFAMSSAYAATAATIDDVFAGAPMLNKPVCEQQLIKSITGIIGSGPSNAIRKAGRKKSAVHPQPGIGV